jgi:hypothetical protein
MDRMQFPLPVRIVTEPGEPVTEIYDVEQALTFLQNWPAAQGSPIFQRALNACIAVTANEGTAEEAQKALAGFARIAGVLAIDEPRPRSREPHDWVRPPAR